MGTVHCGSPIVTIEVLDVDPLGVRDFDDRNLGVEELIVLAADVPAVKAAFRICHSKGAAQR